MTVLANSPSSEPDKRKVCLTLSEINSNVEYFSKLNLEGTFSENSFPAAALRWNQRVLEAYRKGLVELAEESEKQVASSGALYQGALTEPKHPSPRAQRSVPPTISPQEISPISDMSYQSLLTERPFGMIAPRYFGAMIVGRLRIPVSTSQKSGFLESLTLELREELDAIFDGRKYASFPGTGGIGSHEVVLPNYPGSILPVPLGGKVISAPDLHISAPIDGDPAVWFFRPKPGALRYTLDPAAACDSYGAISPKPALVLSPSEAEQAYLREVFPLPAELDDKISKYKETNDIRSITGLLTSYLAAHDQSINLSHFRYVNHDAFGMFLKHHSADLPLIISTLKAGHCDLLCWYLGSLFRSYGITCWATTEMLTTNDGSHFDAQKMHTRLVLVDEAGKLQIIDPSSFCDVDKGYHPAVLSEATVYALDESFSKAATFKAKVAALEKFSKKLAGLREKAKANPKVEKDMQALCRGYFQRLWHFREHSYLKALRTSALNWQRIGAEIPLNKIRIELKNLFNTLRLGRFDEINRYYAPQAIRPEREVISQLLRTFKRHGISLCYAEPLDEGATDLYYICESKRAKGESIRIPLPAEICDEPELYRNLSRLTPRTISTQVETREGPFHQPHEIVPSLSALYKDTTFILRQFFHCNLINGFKKEQFTNFKFVGACLRAGLLVEEVTPSLLNIKLQFLTPNPKKSLEEIAGKADLHVQITEWARFAVAFQNALIDKPWRSELLAHLDIDEEKFRAIAVELASLDMQATRAPLVPRIYEPIQKEIKVNEAMLFIERSCQMRLQRSFQRFLTQISQHPAPSSDLIDSEARPYQIGDDFRSIDWNLTARFDKPLVRMNIYRAHSEDSPLHVLLDFSALFAATTYLKARELIRVLQKNSQREIWIGVCDGEGYLKLSSALRKTSPENVLAMLFNKYAPGEPQLSAGPRLLGGKLPANLIFASSSIGKLAAYKYLFNSPRCAVHGLWWEDQSFGIFPLARQSWLEEGLPEDLIEWLNEQELRRQSLDQGPGTATVT